MTRFHVLSALHIGTTLLLLPLSIMFGIFLAPVILLGLLWILILGFLLFRPKPQVLTMVRRTHFVSIVVAILFCVHGVLALQAAKRSAEQGGGLLGAYGLIPIAFGLLLGAVSIASLLLARSRSASPWS